MTKACELYMILKQMNRGDNSEMHPLSRPHLPLSTSELVLGGYNISLYCVKNKQFQKSTHTLSHPLSPLNLTVFSTTRTRALLWRWPCLLRQCSRNRRDAKQYLFLSKYWLFWNDCMHYLYYEVTEWTQKAVHRSSDRLSGTAETILVKSGNTIRN